MKLNQSLRFVITVIVLLLGDKLANAQDKSAKTVDEGAQVSAELAASTEKYKDSLETLLAMEESNVKQAAETHAKSQQLLAEGIIAKREVEESEQALAAAQAKLDEVRKQLAEANQPQKKVEAAKTAALTRPANVPVKVAKIYRANSKMIRYNGSTEWSLGDLTEVQAFFINTFGRPLPISAMGQSATHNRLGFDHRHAVDVALHPDGAEGKVLINYLEGAGIPYIAFRAAIPGSATGPHIHIGKGSQRMSAR